jgi:hypothetical protein
MERQEGYNEDKEEHENETMKRRRWKWENMRRERTDFSEELSASIFRVTRIGELGTRLAVTSNRRTLRGGWTWDPSRRGQPEELVTLTLENWAEKPPK